MWIGRRSSAIQPCSTNNSGKFSLFLHLRARAIVGRPFLRSIMTASLFHLVLLCHAIASEAVESNPTKDPAHCDTKACVEELGGYSPPPPAPPAPISTRFVFADGETGLWTSVRCPHHLESNPQCALKIP